jgi:lysyl-tRNA synthetase class 2
MENLNQLSEQEIIRRQKLADLTKMGINAYPPESFEVNATSIQIKKEFALLNNL